MRATLNYRELKRRVDLTGLPATVGHITECLEAKALKPQDFSIKALFETLVTNRDGEVIGRDVLNECCDPAGPKKLLTEAAWAVDSSAFSNITGQLVYSSVLDAYRSPEFVFTPLVRNVPTKLKAGEKVAGVTEIGDEAEVVDEAHQFPRVGMSENWIQTPPPKKRGFIVPVTKEAIFYDSTNQVLVQANKGGYWLGVNKEKRIIDGIIDENVTDHRYNWRGTTIATYGDNSGTHTWDNLQASNALADWTDIENAVLLFSGMTDPYTGEPIEVAGNGMTLVISPELSWSAKRIFNATELRVGDGASATYQTISPNPLAGMAPAYASSALLKGRLATDTSWFYGDLRRAFAYMEAWPITPSQAPTNSYEEFNFDIAFQYKVSECGAMSTWEPRAVVKSTVA